MLSEAQALNGFCVHCFDDKQSPNLTSPKKPKILVTYFPQLGRKIFMDRLDFAREIWCDKNGLEQKGVPCMSEGLFL